MLLPSRRKSSTAALALLLPQSGFATVPLNRDVRTLLGPLIALNGEGKLLREASPIA